MDKALKQQEPVSIQPEMLKIVDNTDLTTLDYDALVELGRTTSEVKVYAQWILGKLASMVMTKNEGEPRAYGDLGKYAKDIGQIYEVLQQYLFTYRKFTAEDPKFTPETYMGSVPWGVLQLVAMKSDKPVTLLNELLDKGVHSIDHAYREIKTKQTGKEVPMKPRVVFKFDDGSGKWKIKLRPEDLDLIDWSDVREQLIKYLESLA